LKDASEGVAKGVTEGVLDFASEEIPALITRFRNKDLAFIRDRQAILTVRNERDSPSWKLIDQFLPDRRLRIQVLTGFGLKNMESDKRRMEEVRRRLTKTFGTAGLHVAELAASGIVNELLGRLTTIVGNSTVDVQKALTSFLNNSERLAIWIHQATNIKNTIESCTIRLESSEPHMLMLFAKGSMRKSLKQIIKALSDKGYVIETDAKEDQLAVFVYTQEVRKKIMHWSDLLVRDEGNDE
jgi:hypothetical protein